MGDTHAKPILQRYNMTGISRSIHVGDVGIGFGVDEDILKLYQEMPGKHTFIRGNHDNLSVIKEKFSDYWHQDGSYEKETSMFFVGGAKSVDSFNRIEGKNWWPDEEVDEKEFDKLILKYAYAKPSIVVTHDIPIQAAAKMYDNHEPFDSVTARKLSEMYEAHQPKLWVAGHWHRKRIRDVYGTKFVVCPMDSFFDIDINYFK